jgi:hypothetical protein
MRYRSLGWLFAAFVLLHFFGFVASTAPAAKDHLARPVEVWVNGKPASFRLTDRVCIKLPDNKTEGIEEIKVRIGDRDWLFGRAEVQSRWEFVPGQDASGTLLAPPEVSLPRSVLPMYSKVVNFAGDWFLLKEYLPWLVVSGIFLLAAWLICRRARQNPRLTQAIRRGLGLEIVPSEEGELHRSWPWAGGGLIVLLLAFARLESLEPYYFMQDDNLIEVHPVISYGYQALFAGEIPNWLPYQFAGQPLCLWALLYPPLWLSWAIAQYLLGDANLAFEVFALLHMLAGYGLNYLLARQVGLPAPLAMAGALSLVLSGCTLIMGRSWLTIGTPWLVWLPLSMLCVLRLQRHSVGWKWAALTGLVIGLWHLVGFTPLWLYGMAFLALVVGLLLRAGEVPWRRVPWICVAGLHGLALSVPFTLVLMDIAGPIQREAAYGTGITRGMGAMLLPYPLASAGHPNEWGSYYSEWMGQFYYWGTLFPVAFLLAAMLLLTVRGERLPIGPNVYLFAAIVALLLTLGHAGLLYVLFSVLPVFGPINNHPFRILPELLFFGMLAGGLFLQRFSTAWPNGRRLVQGLSAATVLLLLYHVNLCRASFYSYAERPYPPLPPALHSLLQEETPSAHTLPPARVLSVVRERSAADGFMKSLRHCLPTLYRIPALDGYDPIIETTMPVLDMRNQLAKDPVGTAEALGVRWLLSGQLRSEPAWPAGTYNHDYAGDCPRLPKLKYPREMTARLKAVGRLRLELDGLEVWELPQPDALAFWQSAPKHCLPLHWWPDRMEIDTSEQPPGERLVVNFLWRRQWHAYAGDQPLPVEEDLWHRMVVMVPPGTQQVTLRFEPPWQRGLVFGLVFEGMAIVASMVLSRWDRARNKRSSFQKGLPCEIPGGQPASD